MNNEHETEHEAVPSQESEPKKLFPIRFALGKSAGIHCLQNDRPQTLGQARAAAERYMEAR